jgi:hypothetical protein
MLMQTYVTKAYRSNPNVKNQEPPSQFPVAMAMTATMVAHKPARLKDPLPREDGLVIEETLKSPLLPIHHRHAAITIFVVGLPGVCSMH